jgi:hypothetical protein
MSDGETAESTSPSRRPLRFVFSLLHAGYLRHYGEPIRLLVERGHSVHLVLFSPDAAPSDTALLHRLVEDCQGRVSWSETPRRDRTDGWRALAWLVRSLADVVRYADPRYATSEALKERAAEKVRTRVGASRADPLTRLLARRVLALVARSDERAARRYLARLLAIERAIPSSRRHERMLIDVGADAVLATPVVEFGSPQVEFVKSAQQLGIPSAVAVASWDNLSSKGLLRVVPDRVIVWNETQRRELEEMHGVPSERVVVTGAQKFDAWFERRPSTTRPEFAQRVGLDASRPYVLYLCSSSFIAPDEVPFVRRWLDALRSSDDARVRELGALIRPHPQNVEPWLDADLSAYPNVVVWPRGGEHPDSGGAESGFFDAIAHAAAVVGVNTSAQIDAAVVGRPVYTIRDPAFAASQDGTIHFAYLLQENGGFVRSAGSLDEHRRQLADGLGDPEGARAELQHFVAWFVRPRGVDRPVAPIVADEIEALARLSPSAPPQRGALVLRAALTPLMLALRLGATVLFGLTARR